MAQDFESALTEELKGISAFGSRVYPVYAQDADAGQGVPYLIYVPDFGVPTKSLDGYLASRETQVEINIVASGFSSLKSLTDETIKKLTSFSRRKIGTDGPFVRDLSYQRPAVMYEQEPRLHRCLIDFTFYYRE